MFQGQSLTPFAQTSETSRRGFDALLNVAREAIASKRQSDALKEEIKAKKDLTVFQFEEQLKYDKAKFEAVDKPIANAVNQTRAGIDALKLRNDARTQFSKTFFDQYEPKLSPISSVAGSMLNYEVDPDTGFEPVINFGFKVVNPETGEVTTDVRTISETELRIHAENMGKITSWVKNVEDNMDDISENNLMLEPGTTTPLAIPRYGKGYIQSVLREIRSGSALGIDYSNKIMNGELQINTEKDLLETANAERRQAVNANYGILVSDLGFGNPSGGGSFAVTGTDGKVIKSIDFKTNIKSILQQFEKIRRDNFTGISVNNKTLTPDEAMQMYAPEAYRKYQTLNSLLQQWYSENTTGVQSDKIYINPNRSADQTDISSIFIVGSSTSRASGLVQSNLN